jgi:hypothetical protein
MIRLLLALLFCNSRELGQAWKCLSCVAAANQFAHDSDVVWLAASSNNSTHADHFCRHNQGGAFGGATVRLRASILQLLASYKLSLNTSVHKRRLDQAKGDLSYPAASMTAT